jgi:hypothetical protein
VSQDRDGPIERCRPVLDDQAAALAPKMPELVLRRQPAHPEALVNVGAGSQINSAQTGAGVTISADRVDEYGLLHPSELDVRIPYLAGPPIAETSRHDFRFRRPALVIPRRVATPGTLRRCGALVG